MFIYIHICFYIYIYVYTHVSMYTVCAYVAPLVDAPGDLDRTWYVAAKMAVVFCEAIDRQKNGVPSGNQTWFAGKP